MLSQVIVSGAPLLEHRLPPQIDAALRSTDKALGSLELNQVTQPSPLSKAALVLLNGLETATSLRSLSLTHTELSLNDPNASSALRKCLQALSSLSELLFVSSSIGPREQLAPAISACASSTLTVLTIQHGKVGATGARALTTAWQAAPAPGPQLRSLVLRDVGLGDDGIGHLCAGLPALKQLTALDIVHNAMYDGGLVSLSIALAKMPQLQRLSISAHLKRKGADALASAWQQPDPEPDDSLPCLEPPLLPDPPASAGKQGMASAPGSSCGMHALEAGKVQKETPREQLSPHSEIIAAKEASPTRQGRGASAAEQAASPQLQRNSVHSNVSGATAHSCRQLNLQGGSNHSIQPALPIRPAGPSLQRLAMVESSFLEARATVLLLSALPLLRYVSHLDLSSSDLGPSGGSVLAAVLPNMLQLQHLNLTRTAFTTPQDAHAEAIALGDAWKALFKSGRPVGLRTICCPGDATGWASGLLACGALPLALPQLEEVDFSGSTVRPMGQGFQGLLQYGAELRKRAGSVIAVPETPRGRKSRGVVELGPSPPLPAMAPVLALKRLCLEGLVGFGDAEACALAQAVLASAPALEELELSHSGLGQEGGAAIGAALAHCGALSLLAVGHTGFGDAGAKALAGSVRCLTKLRTLYLEDCGINTAAAVLLVKSFIANSGLSGLQLLNMGSKGWWTYPEEQRSKMHANRGLDPTVCSALEAAWLEAPHLSGSQLALTVKTQFDDMFFPALTPAQQQEVAAALAAGGKDAKDDKCCIQ